MYLKLGRSIRKSSKDRLNLYDEEVIDQEVENGSLSPEDAAIIRGNMMANDYSEEEE